MKKDLTCPHCGKVFQVDEAEYASIANQVKNKEFDAEVERRMAELHKRIQAEQELAKAKAEQEYQKKLAQKEVELQKQLIEIGDLKNQLKSIGTQKEAELTKALAEKDKEIVQLNSVIRDNDSKLQLAVIEEQKKAQDAAQSKDKEIAQLRLEKEQQIRAAQAKEAAQKEQFEAEIKSKQELIDYYKDFKTRMTTKMVGESLEQHCSNQYDQYIRPILPDAEFGKDNEVVEGTKGDFIFRYYVNGILCLSILFEMKNESDTKSVKHKNEDFLKKVNEDRIKKGCEYAVLVSLLEPDNEYYNTGIVSMESRYPKMYVIRPQFFVPLIQLLLGMAKNNLEDKIKLKESLEREVDITNFETELEGFKEDFGRNYRIASTKFKTAIDEIDKTIEHLQKIREALTGSENQLRLANGKAEDLTIKKLTRKNPTMKAKFEEARKAAAESVKEITDSNESDEEEV